MSSQFLPHCPSYCPSWPAWFSMDKHLQSLASLQHTPKVQKASGFFFWPRISSVRTIRATRGANDLVLKAAGQHAGPGQHDAVVDWARCFRLVCHENAARRPCESTHVKKKKHSEMRVESTSLRGFDTGAESWAVLAALLLQNMPNNCQPVRCFCRLDLLTNLFRARAPATKGSSIHPSCQMLHNLGSRGKAWPSAANINATLNLVRA